MAKKEYFSTLLNKSYSILDYETKIILEHSKIDPG